MLMYSTALGEASGDDDAATRRMLWLEGVPGESEDSCGAPMGDTAYDSLAPLGERAKLGMRKASRGAECATSMSFLSDFMSGDSGVLPLETCCMPPLPL